MLLVGGSAGSFEGMTLADISPVPVLPSQPGVAMIGTPVLELIANGMFFAPAFAALIKNCIGFPASEIDGTLLDLWIRSSDNVHYIESGRALHRASILQLPNRFLLLRIYRLWHEDDMLSQSLVQAEVVRTLWDTARPSAAELALEPRLLFANPAGHRWLGRNSPVGKRMQDLAPKLICAGVLELAQRDLRGAPPLLSLISFNDTCDINVRFASKNSLIVSFQDSSATFLTRILKTRLEGVLNAVPVLCLLATQNGQVIYMNAKGRKMVDFPADMSVDNLLVCDILPSVGSSFLNAELCSNMNLETDLLSLSGSKLPVRLTCAPLDCADAKFGFAPDAIAIFAQDMSKEVSQRNFLTEGKRRAEEAASAKGDFLATMSHEIRTPLHGIVGCTELLEESTAEDLWQQQQVRNIKDCSMALLTIINDLLDFAKIEVRVAPEPQRLAFSPVRSVGEKNRLGHSAVRSVGLCR